MKTSNVFSAAARDGCFRGRICTTLTLFLFLLASAFDSFAQAPKRPGPPRERDEQVQDEDIRPPRIHRGLPGAAGQAGGMPLVAAAAVASPLAKSKPSFSPPTEAIPLVTDRDNLPLSNQFRAVGSGAFRLASNGTGDVFFGVGGALFRWNYGTRARTRILQTNDPFPGLSGSVTQSAGAGLRVNAAGHALSYTSTLRKGEHWQSGLYIYDGASFHKVVVTGDVAPGTGGRVISAPGANAVLNDSDQVAFIGYFTPIPGNPGGYGLFAGSPGQPLQKIAAVGDPAPGTGGTFSDFVRPIGINNAGQVAFLGYITGGTTDFALFIGTPSSVSLVAANGMAAPGTTTGWFGLPGNVANYFLNALGDVAFRPNVWSDPSYTTGIWIGNASGALTKLVLNNDPTSPTPLGGTYDGALTIRGFSGSGQVLFSCNLGGGASSTHALFLKDALNTQVVFSAGQVIPVPGHTETFNVTSQAALNDLGQVAFLASLVGNAGYGWFLGTGGSTPPEKIVLQGEPTPVGGTFGLAGELFVPELNNSGQVAFVADILGPNGIGVFHWTPGSGLRSVVSTSDALPAGANRMVSYFPSVTDNSAVFFAWKVGGRMAVFSKKLLGNGPVTKLFSEGDTAPAIGGALWRFNANFPMVNAHEEVAFRAIVVGGSVYQAEGIFTYRPGVGLRKVVTTGDAAPGAGGGTFTTFTYPMYGEPNQDGINIRGEVAFFGNMTSTSSRTGIFLGSAGNAPQSVVRLNDPSPLGSGTITYLAPGVSLNAAGQVAFSAGTNTGQAIFVGSGVAPPVKVVADGDPGPSGTTFNGMPSTFWQMNDAGQVAYVTGLSGGFITQGIFLGTAGNPQQVVALVNDPAPGTLHGRFSVFDEGSIKLNQMGQVAFWGATSDPIATTGNFLGSALGFPEARLLEGQPLPGGGSSGYVFPGSWIAVGDDFALTDDGKMCMYVGSVTGAPDLTRLVIANSNGKLSEFITPNDKATGTGGSLFGEVNGYPVTNSAGHFFVNAFLVNGPVHVGIFWDGKNK